MTSTVSLWYFLDVIGQVTSPKKRVFRVSLWYFLDVIGQVTSPKKRVRVSLWYFLDVQDLLQIDSTYYNRNSKV